MIAELFMIKQIKSYIVYEVMSLSGMEKLQPQINRDQTNTY